MPQQDMEITLDSDKGSQQQPECTALYPKFDGDTPSTRTPRLQAGFRVSSKLYCPQV